MAYWLDKHYGSLQPNFRWTSQAQERRGLSGSGLSISRPLSAKNVPSVGRPEAQDKRKLSSDIFFVSASICCNERFRALVEQFEPDLHLFVPIELQGFEGKRLDGEYFYFSAGQDIDCIMTDNNPDWFIDGPNGIYSTLRRNFGIYGPMAQRAQIHPKLSIPQIVDKHLWTGGPLGWNEMFVSDDFYDAICKHRIKGLTLRWPCDEVDRPWLPEENMGPMLEKWREYVAAGRNMEAEYA